MLKGVSDPSFCSACSLSGFSNSMRLSLKCFHFLGEMADLASLLEAYHK